MPNNLIGSLMQRHQAVPDGMWVTRDGVRHRIEAWCTGLGHAPTLVTVCGLTIPFAMAPDPSATPCGRCR